MPPTLREAATMALDAYDARSATNAPGAPAPADPAVEDLFPGWAVQETDRASAPRNASAAYGNGMEANIYANAARGEVVVAFRGTEIGRFLEAVDDVRIGLIREANLDDDILTLLGYYQDGGETIGRFIAAQGGLEAFLRDTLEIAPGRADSVADTLDLLGGGVDALAEEGEQTLRNQVQTAVLTVLQAAEMNPDASITVVGHSLGGALAASVAGALGVPGVLFDPAPYGAAALLDFARSEAVRLIGERFPGLDPAARGWDLDTAPEAHLADLTATHRLEGSFVPELYLTASPLDLPEGESTDRVIELEAPGADALLLHAPDLLTLAVDSAGRAGPGRPSLEALAETVPSLVDLSADGARTSPADDASGTFYRSLLVSDPFYALLSELVAEVSADLARFAPAGSDEYLRAELERAVLGIGLDGMGAIVADSRIDAPGPVAGLLGNPEGSAGDDVIVGAYRMPDTVAPGLGTDFVALGQGPDTLSGTLAALDGDTWFDPEASDLLRVTDAALGPESVSLARGGRELRLDGATLALGRPADPQSLSVEAAQGRTEIRLSPLEEGLDEAAVRRVALLFEAGLGRKAAPEGLNHWVDAREAGLTEAGLGAAFLGSREFEARVGDPETLAPEELVSALFLNILDRPGAEAGIEHWSAALGREGFGPERLLLAFAVAPENVAGAEDLDRLVETAPGFWDFA